MDSYSKRSALDNPLLKLLLLLPALAIFTGCATVTTGTSQTIAVNSDPSGASCDFTHGNRTIGSVRETPGSITVDKGEGTLTARCHKEGYKDGVADLSSHFQAMTLGNVLIGGFIGLVVDAASGAAMQYPSAVMVTLIPTSFATAEKRDAFFGKRRKQFLADYEKTLAQIKSRCKQEYDCETELKKAETAKKQRLAEIEQQRVEAKIDPSMPESVAAGAVSTEGKLAALQTLYKEGVIDEKEYIEKRKGLMDAQVDEELQTLKEEKEHYTGAVTAAALSPQPTSPAINAARPEPDKLKVAIFPIDGRSGWSPNVTGAEQPLIDTAKAYIRESDKLTLSFSYIDGHDRDAISSNASSLWTGGVVRKEPNTARLAVLGPEVGADCILTYRYYFSAAFHSRKELSAYLYDVERRVLYTQAGSYDDAGKLTERVFSEFLVHKR